MHEEHLLVPEKRVRELLDNKKKIEENCNVKIDIERDGLITISGKEVLDCDTAKRIAKAIARGFDAKDALILLEEDSALEIIDIMDFRKNTRRNRELLRGRIIGTHGRVKRNIEMMTKTKICVSGKTAAIIGKLEDVFLVRQALELILSGSRQTTAYQFLRESLEKRD